MYGLRAVTLLVLISDDDINRILKLNIQTNILVYVTRCCTDLTSKVLKERTFGQSSALLLTIGGGGGGGVDKQKYSNCQWTWIRVCRSYAIPGISLGDGWGILFVIFFTNSAGPRLARQIQTV